MSLETNQVEDDFKKIFWLFLVKFVCLNLNIAWYWICTGALHCVVIQLYIHPGLKYVLLGTYGPEYRSFCAKKAFLGHSPKFKDTRTILDSAYIDLCQHLLQLLSKLWGKITFPNQFLITLPSKLCNAYPLWTILAMLSSKGALYQIRYDLSVNWSKLYTSTVPVLTGLKNTQFHVAAFLMWKERHFLNSYSTGS